MMSTKVKYHPEMTDRLVPPHSEEDEMAVLSSVFLDSETFDEMAVMLRPEDFYRQDHQAIYLTFLELQQKRHPINVLSVLQQLEADGVEMDRGQLVEIAHHASYAATWRYHAGVVKEKAAKRGCIHVAQSLMAAAYDPTVDSGAWRLAADQLLIETCTNTGEPKIKSAKDVMIEYCEYIDATAAGAVKRVPWGFSEIDRAIGFMYPGEMIVLAARPSMGKSAFAMNVAEYNAGEGRKVLIFSLEMPARDLGGRVMSGMAGIDGQHARNGTLPEKERQLLSEASIEFSQLHLFFCDRPRMTVTDILHEAMRHKRKHGLDLVIVDYLGLVTPDNPKASRYEQTTAISAGLKMIARETDVPLIVLCQLNRTGNDAAKPSLRELRDSGAIEQDADRVGFIVRGDVENRKFVGSDRKDDPKAMLIFEKNRNGPIDNIRLTWNPSAVRFESAVRQRPANYEPTFNNPQ